MASAAVAAFMARMSYGCSNSTDSGGQRQKVHVAQVAHGRGAKHHRVPGARDNSSARLAGELAGLEGDLIAAYLHRDAAYVKHAHVLLPFGRPDGGPIVKELLVL